MSSIEEKLQKARTKSIDPGFTIPERKWGDPGMVIPERRWERDPEHMKKLYELFMERKFGPNWRVRKRHPERMKFGPEQRHPEEMTFEEMPRGDREAPPVSSGWLAKGGRVGLALGGDPYMEDYRDKEADIIPAPGDEMIPDDEQGIVSQLTNEQDPERKIMLAIQIIQSMGDRGIEIVESILSPEEIAMAVQVIQQMDTGADQGIDNVQMAAEGGRTGLRNGGPAPDEFLAYINRDEADLLKAHGGSGRMTDQGIPSFQREFGMTGKRPGHEAKTYDMVDAYRRKIHREMGGGEIQGNAQLQQAMANAQRKAELAEWTMADKPVAGSGAASGAMKRVYEPMLQGGYAPEDLVDAETAAYIPTRIYQPKVEKYGRRRDEEQMNAAIARLHPELAQEMEELTQVIAPGQYMAGKPIYDPHGLHTDLTSPAGGFAKFVGDQPLITKPIEESPLDYSTGPSPTVVPSAPSALDYASQAATPAATPASPVSNMSQYYSNLFSPESTSADTPSVASQIAAQYLTPQEAQVYAANGGRIGFDNGGSPDDYLLEPGVMETNPDELLQEIETQGGLQTAQSTMGNMLMKAMEDSHWMEIGSWLDQYSGFGLSEEDYFNFRTMGPQVKGPEATEGLASVRV